MSLVPTKSISSEAMSWEQLVCRRESDMSSAAHSSMHCFCTRSTASYTSRCGSVNVPLIGHVREISPQ